MKIYLHAIFSLITLFTLTTAMPGCVDSGKLQSITITPTEQVIGPGVDQQFRATAHFSDGTNLDWTAACAWTVVSGPTVTIGNRPGTYGLLASSAVGTYEIQATDTEINLSARTFLYVANAIRIIPEAPFMDMDTNNRHQFSFVPVFSQGAAPLTYNLTSLVTWTVTDQSVATVGADTGLVESKATGTTNLVALYSTLSFTATLTVKPQTLESVAIDQIAPVLSHPTSTHFTARGNYGSGGSEVFTKSVIWGSSNGDVASVDKESGLVTTKQAGLTTITAKDLVSGIAGTTTLVVQ